MMCKCFSKIDVYYIIISHALTKSDIITDDEKAT